MSETATDGSATHALVDIPAPAVPRIKVTVTHSPDPARRALLEALMAEVRAEMDASATKAS